MNCHAYVLAGILLPQLASAVFFDVKRFSAEVKDGNEPYRPVNYFLNKQRRRSICLFMFCWRHHGNCRSSTDCCECVCKRTSTYFSEPHGCKPAPLMSAMTKEVGNECRVVSRKSGFEYVPLFDNGRKLVDLELVLPEGSHAQNKPTCVAGYLHDHDYHGHKLLFNRNHCSELFFIQQNRNKNQGVKYFLSFRSSNITVWESFRGRLLSLDIHCNSQHNRIGFSSCFLFQVEGKYKEEIDSEPPAPVSPDGSCPSLSTDLSSLGSAAPTTSTNNTRVKGNSTRVYLSGNLGETSGGSSNVMMNTSSNMSFSESAVRSSVRPTTYSFISLKRSTNFSTVSDGKDKSKKRSLVTSSPPSSPTSTITIKNRAMEGEQGDVYTTKTTENLVVVQALVKVKEEPTKTPHVTVIYLDAKDTMTSTTIGILTGLGTGLAIVMVCIIIWIIVKKRKYFLLCWTKTNTQMFNDSIVIPYEENGYYYDVPNLVAKPLDTRSPSVPTDIPPVSTLPQPPCVMLPFSRNIAPMVGSIDSMDSDYCRPYSFIEDKVMEDYDEPGLLTRENSILLMSRGNSVSNMSKRPLPEKPMESGNPYYSASSLVMDTIALTRRDERREDGNQLYSLYSTIDEVQDL